MLFLITVSLNYNKFMKSLKIALCLLFATPLLYSQETVKTAGGEDTGSGTVSYSRGGYRYLYRIVMGKFKNRNGLRKPRG